jgi:hypothetical protein
MPAVLLLLAAACLGGTPTMPEAAPVPWIANASSSEADLTPDLAIDGDPSTRWSSRFEDDQWWQVDFVRARRLDRVILLWEAAFTGSYDVLVSTDGVTWKTVHSTENGQGGREEITFAPENARLVRLNLRRRATEWGHSLLEVRFDDPNAGVTATASSGDGAYDAAMAVDGDMRTRWSSVFEDNQWWMAEFDAPRLLNGLTIHWETAFGEIYSVEAAGPDGNFRKVYETAIGDGRRDIIHFRPMLVKRLRINGIQRGTGWGFSIFEVEFHDGHRPQILAASSTAPGSDPLNAMDGLDATAWRSAPSASEAELLVTLPVRREIGGLFLTWAEDFPRSYRVDGSLDGETWRPLYASNENEGGISMIHLVPTPVRHLKIACRESATGKGFSLAEIELKASEEKATPIKLYQAAARSAKPGRYPIWLGREQEFWTVVGLPGFEHESLISEIGSVEPVKGGFTVMPYLHAGEQFITYADGRLQQSLMESALPIPSVGWRDVPLELEVTAVATGSPGRAFTAVRYRVRNATTAPIAARLALAILPVQINPIWQEGGLSPIDRLEFTTERGFTVARVNGRPRLYAPAAPAAMGAANHRAGGVVGRIERNQAPPDRIATDPDGLAAGALFYDLALAAGEAREIILFLPLDAAAPPPRDAALDPAIFFEKRLAEAADLWRPLINRFQVAIPEKRLIDCARSNIAYILINKDGPWIKPGSRRYSHSWIRDGAMTSVALLRMGIVDEVRKWIEAVMPHVASTGMVPYIIFEDGRPVGFDYTDTSGEGKEYDAQGQFVYAARQYYDYTGDRAFLRRVYPKVISALKFTMELRRQRLTDEYMNDPRLQAYRGILPLSNSHEGYYPAMHSHWDNFWCLRGLKDGIHLAAEMERAEDLRWMTRELEEFRGAVMESIRFLIAEKGIDHIPGCVEKADCDPTSTSIAVMVTGDAEHLPRAPLKAMYDRYYDEFVRGMRPGDERTFTPYEVRTAEAFIRMGQRERALVMLRHFVKDSVRPFGWNHMAEVVHARYRAPSYIGDMPHTWVGSGYINAVRAIFEYEQMGELTLGAGLDPAWFREGVTVKDLPTLFGPISFTVRQADANVLFDVTGRAAPPDGFRLPLPAQLAGRTATVNGMATPVENGVIRFARLPARVEVK